MMTGVLIKREMDTDTQTHTAVEGRRPCDAEAEMGAMQLLAKEHQGLLSTTGSQEEEARIFLEPSEGGWPRRHLDSDV